MGGYIGAKVGTLVATAADISGDITATDSTPELILKNTSEEDTEGGREGKITFKGEQSGGEETTLAQIESAHDGTSDDEKGDLIFKTNDGNDGAAPTERLRLDSAGDMLLSSPDPSFTITNTTQEDTDGGRESTIVFKGEQSGGELSTLAEIEASHDGTSDDEKGDLIFKTNDGSDGASPTERMRIDSAGQTKITGAGNILTVNAASGVAYQNFQENNTNRFFLATLNGADGLAFVDADGSAERMRIDDIGNLNIGSNSNVGYGPLQIGSTSNANTIAQFLSTTSGYGTIHFGDATSGGGRYAGFIQYNHSGNRLNLSSTTTLALMILGSERMILDDNEFYPNPDNYVTLGWSGGRFVQVYAVSGTINTSDRNEKQDIEDLSEAEKRVATAAKGLIKKYRWIDAVQKKGDDARIHVGIIAQDLQAAFESEGLDPHRYGMFCSDTWWEKDRTVPATEDKEEHTVTDSFRTQEEAPEGATERTRLGVRYEELLAFIIGAM